MRWGRGRCLSRSIGRQGLPQGETVSRFTRLLKVAPLPDGYSWVLLEALHYEVGGLGSGVTVTVPKGFQTDFASVPRPLWALINRQGYHTNASVLHDFLYWNQELPRWAADQVFLEAMAVSGTLWSVRHLMFRAVRLFGWLAWWANQKDRERGHNRVLAILPNAGDPVPPRGLDRLFIDLFRSKRAEPIEKPPPPEPAAAKPDILSGFTDKTIDTPEEKKKES